MPANGRWDLIWHLKVNTILAFMFHLVFSLNEERKANLLCEQL